MQIEEINLLLLVEDDDELRNMVASFLILEGFNVRTAGHGIKAVRFLELQSPSAVILDLGLPWLDGFGVLAVMRQQPSTVRAGRGYRRNRCQRGGAPALFARPVDSQTVRVRAAIASSFRRARRGAQLAPSSALIVRFCAAACTGRPS